MFEILCYSKGVKLGYAGRYWNKVELGGRGFLRIYRDFVIGLIYYVIKILFIGY